MASEPATPAVLRRAASLRTHRSRRASSRRPPNGSAALRQPSTLLALPPTKRTRGVARCPLHATLGGSTTPGCLWGVTAAVVPPGLPREAPTAPTTDPKATLAHAGLPHFRPQSAGVRAPTPNPAPLRATSTLGDVPGWFGWVGVGWGCAAELEMLNQRISGRLISKPPFRVGFCASFT